MKTKIRNLALCLAVLGSPQFAAAADVTLGFDNLCDVLDLTYGPNGTVYGRQIATSGECASPDRDYLVAGRYAAGNGGILFTGMNGSSTSSFTTIILNANQSTTAHTQTGNQAPTADARWNGRTWRLVTGTPTTGSTVTVEQKCNVGTTSGGEGTNIANYEMSASCGTFNLTYNMYSVPDSLDATYEGKTLFSTNGYVSSGQTVSVKYCGTTTKISVKVVGSQSGTAWDYSVSCPTP